MDAELIEDEALVLQTCIDNRYSVREVVRRVPMRRSRAVHLLKGLERLGLLTFEKEASGGRPRKIALVTELGADFLATFRRLQLQRGSLFLNENEVQRVARQVERVRRLEAMGVDLGKRMLEMVEFGRLLGQHQEDRRRP